MIVLGARYSGQTSAQTAPFFTSKYMNAITLRVLDGSDRGRVYEGIAPPVTIGREEGNTIQLNDERVSRFHIKIQEDNDKLVLTDLESTNGTKVNGEEIQLRILRIGDMISVGRSVLLLGSREDIAKRVSKLQPNSHLSRGDSGLDLSGKVEEFAKKAKHDSRLQARIYDAEPPELPSRLSPGQAAQLSELLEYVHIRLRELVSDIHADRNGEVFELDIRQWQYLLDLQARVSEYLRNVGHPNEF